MIPKWAETPEIRKPLFTAEQIAEVRAITHPEPPPIVESPQIREIIKIKRKKNGE